MSEDGRLQNYSVDQAAGAVVLVLGAVASLLLVIWQSKCHCKINLCYLFQCERRPPNEEEMKSLQEQVQDRQDKKDEKEKEKQDKIPSKEAPDEKLIPDTKETINLDDKV